MIVLSDKQRQCPKRSGIIKNGKREAVSVPQKKRNHQEREERSSVSSPKEAESLRTGRDKPCQFPKSSGIIKNGKREDVSVPQKQQNPQEREETRRVSSPKAAESSRTGRDKPTQFPKNSRILKNGKRQADSIPQNSGILKNGKREAVSVPQKQWNH
ncbi:hypothetical protein [Ureibacillus chungkukjangi]|uniref:Uncharacterized protein n=1 Tax=Ureibacillus chungkukjangi TaxID=1202712 RepID=A0A318TS04_9BACL|nr:hypothetical protein [Ureibacillus chungkukjangi]PYF05808.1 hypothetical protein BJ095_11578 [Ureibacillus chungkukjangi]